jgi:endoglucanase
MQRREFSKTALAATAVAVTGAGCGGGADAPAADGGSSAVLSRAARGPLAAPAGGPAIGVNLSGMEWSDAGLRFGGGTAPNIHFTVPRAADVAYLAAQGYTKTRLVIKWEMLQPMLHDTVANAAARAAIGEPGGFNMGYALSIRDILDAHAEAGIKCIIDLHNYCRYRDFVFQPDGSVIGLVQPTDPLVRAYTTDNTQVQTRIMSTAPGATLLPAHLNYFWATVAGYIKDHPGFGGYGLMNEPYYMPRPGETVEAYQGFGQDLTIWPTFAQSAINAIRAVDPTNPIYLGGNNWSGAMTIGDDNPGWPLAGANIVYEVHTYLDAYTNGQSYDWDIEVAKNYTAGIGNQPINLDTGVDRLRIAVNWAAANGVTLALTETGMPVDDTRWEESYRRMVAFAQENNVEVFSWHGGSHWTLHNASINHTPGWYQNKTLEPIASGPMKASAGINQAVLFDAGAGWAPPASPITITVFARGALTSQVTLRVASNNGGTFSKTTLTIPAGSNGQDSFTFTPANNAVATLTYTFMSGGTGLTVPPPRKVYSLTDPVAYAATSLTDAAMAIIAKYSACKWDLTDGYTDYLDGAPAGNGQTVRAIADSGYGSSLGNAMEMLNWTNTDRPGMGNQKAPVMRVYAGMKISDHTAADTYGFWCRKVLQIPGSQPNPRNRVPYDVRDSHFTIATIGLAGATSGVMFQASNATAAQTAELAFSNGQPQAKWIDINSQAIVLTSAAVLAPNAAHVISMTSTLGAQRLRVNRTLMASAAATFAASPLDQMLMGWGFNNYYPTPGFGGYIKAVVTGRGAPSDAELVVLERYLGSLAGLS